MSHMHFIDREPTTSERFGKAFAGLGQTLAQDIPKHFLDKMQSEKQKEAIKRLTGMDVSGIDDPKAQLGILETLLKGTGKSGSYKEGGKVMEEIGNSNLPVSTKTQLMDALKSQAKEDQQSRLKLEVNRKIYNDKIKEIQSEIKEARYKEKGPLQERMKLLQEERDRVLGFNKPEEKSEPETLEEPREASEKTAKKKKPKFDASNKEHQAKARQLMETFKDKEKVREALAMEFEF